jgi:hypothetical protein
MRESLQLREFHAADAPQVNGLALAAFAQFKTHYSDWPAMASLERRRLPSTAKSSSRNAPAPSSAR